MLKFTAETKPLLAALKSCVKLAGASGSHPIYESVFVRGMPGQPLELSATNLETSALLRVPASIFESGLGVLPAARFAEIVGKLPPGEFVVSVDQETLGGVVKAGRGTFKLAGHNPKDFPETPENSSPEAVAIPLARFRQAVARVGPAISKDRKRYALDGMLIRASRGRIDFVGTDGCRLALDVFESDSISFAWQVVVKAEALALIGDLDGDEVRLSTSHNHLFATTPGGSVVARVLEGAFPKYDDVIPKKNLSVVSAPRLELLAALERAEMVDAQLEGVVRLDISENELTLSASTTERESRESLAVDYAGPALTIGFRSRFVVDALGALDGETALLRFSKADQPLLVTEEAQVHVVMPVSLDGV